jgi:NAD kinase
MKIKYTNEEILKAFVLVIEIVSKNGQYINHFYSGDKDTRFLAASNVFKENNMPDVYSLTDKQRGYYIDFYNEDIKNNFNKLVEFGKGEIKTIGIVEEYLKNQYEGHLAFEENNELGKTETKYIDILEDKDIDDKYEPELPF